MRVLFITNWFPPSYTGGAEVATYHTCRALIRLGFDCSVLVINNRAPEIVDEWYELDGIPVHRVVYRRTPRTHLTDVFDWRIYRTVKSNLTRTAPDLVHVQNVSGSTLAPYVACRRLNLPVVNTLHDLGLLCPNNMLYRADGSFCDPVKASDCRHCFRRYDYWGAIPYRRRVFAGLTSNVQRFISPSQALIERHVEAGYQRERFRLVRLGFEDRPSHSKQTDQTDAIPLTSGRPTLVFAGGGVQIKGAGVLLRALPALAKAVDGIRLIVAGGGEESILAEFRKYQPTVQVLGQMPFGAMRSLFAQADLTLVPSVWHENSPVVIYESFQSGTPVVGTELGGVPELVTHGQTGYLFPVGDAQALVDCVRSHFSLPARERRLMRLRCVQEVRTRFSLEQHLTALQTVYREVLDGKCESST